MPASTLTIRIDDELKRDASEVASFYGFDLSSITRAFYTQMVRDHAIPIDLGYSKEIPNAETLAAIKEAEYMMAHPEEFRSFSTAEEMITSILNEGE